MWGSRVFLWLYQNKNFRKNSRYDCLCSIYLFHQLSIAVSSDTDFGKKLRKTDETHARPLYNNNLIVPTILSPRRSKSNVARKKGKGIGLRLILKFSISIRNPLVCPKVYFLLPFCPDQGFSNVCLISHLHKFAVIIFQRQSGGISRQEMGNIFWWDLIKETEHLEPQHIKQLKQQRRETHVVEFSSWGGILCHNEQEENYNHRRDGGLKACEESVGCN